MTTEGSQLFARYAYAPNDLGYCGPAESTALLAAGCGDEVDVAPIARRFTGAWPYLLLLAELAGIDDPLDPRVARAYWTGSPLLDEIDAEAFGIKLLELIGSQAGSYWGHLDSDLLPEVSATHGFHVFGVYPWSRLLGGPASAQALHVLDRCRIRWGRVLSVSGSFATVRSRLLGWDGCRLRLPAAVDERVQFAVDGRTIVEPAVGDWLALHWDWACERLSPVPLGELRRRTAHQLRLTNARLAAA